MKKTHVFTTSVQTPPWPLAAKLIHLKDDDILRRVAEEIEQGGSEFASPRSDCRGDSRRGGTLTRREPSKKEWADIPYGWDVGKQIGALDIGQCVVEGTE